MKAQFPTADDAHVGPDAPVRAAEQKLGRSRVNARLPQVAKNPRTAGVLNGHGSQAAEKLRQMHRIREGTSSLVLQSAEKGPGFSP